MTKIIVGKTDREVVLELARESCLNALHIKYGGKGRNKANIDNYLEYCYRDIKELVNADLWGGE